MRTHRVRSRPPQKAVQPDAQDPAPTAAQLQDLRRQLAQIPVTAAPGKRAQRRR